jgi:hypothetical protein
MELQTLDLHGFTVADAVARFVGRYNRLLSSTPPGSVVALDVVHGKGKGEGGGAIKETLRDILRRHGKRVTGFDGPLLLRGAIYLLDKYPGDLVYIHGEDATRNAGSTIVIPRRRIDARSW